MNINLAVISPPGNPHALVFEEVLQLFSACLRDLGHQVQQTENNFKGNMLNLLIGYHYLPAQMLATLPAHLDYILLQREQLNFEAGWFVNSPEAFRSFLPLFRQSRQIWDYCPENLDFLNKFGIQARCMPLGFHPDLVRFEPVAEPDIDVLFYGSAHPRRFDLLQELEKHCRVEKRFGLYGPERDALIARSKIILNLHSHEQLKLLEQVRIFYLLSNRCFVISEASSWNPYGDGIITCAYEQIVPCVLEWLARDAQARQQVADRGLAKIKTVPMQEQLQAALAELSDENPFEKTRIQ